MKDTKPLYEVRPIKDLKDLVNSSTEIFKDRIAYLVKNEKKEYVPIKYEQVKIDMDALGTALIDLGLKDKKVAVIGENRYEWAITYLSVINGTGVIVPLDKQLPIKEIENCIKRAEVSAIVYSSKLQEQINQISQDIDSVQYFIGMDSKKDDGKFLSFEKLLNKGKELVKKSDKSFIDAKIDNTKMASLVFTSGTTSESKAVMLSHKNLCFNIENQCKMLEVTPEDRFLSLLPLHHVYECTCGFLTPFYRGASVAYCEGLKYIQKNMQEAHVSIVLAVPLVFETIYKKILAGIEKQGKTALVKKMIKLTNALDKVGIHLKRKIFKEVHEQLGGKIKVLIAGAAAINPEVSKGFRDFGMLAVQGYGLTECAPIVCLNRDVFYKDDACGLPLINTQVEIDNPNEEGIGEIKTKGEHIMLGYYQNQKATDEVIKDGWFYTGDLGKKDEDGFIHITGRKKNVIITKNGKNVYPEEIEPLINEMTFVKECMIYGKKEKDDIVITAQIILDRDEIESKYGNVSVPSDEEIKSHIWEDIKVLNSNLVIYKHVKKIEIRTHDFEKTTTMKIKRYVEK